MVNKFNLADKPPYDTQMDPVCAKSNDDKKCTK